MRILALAFTGLVSGTITGVLMPNVAAAEGDALVIGNSSYNGVQTLFAATQVAETAQALRDNGFDVTEARDAGGAAMSDGFRTFVSAIDGDDGPVVVILAGAFAHADHGSWLLPAADGSGLADAAVMVEAFPVEAVLSVLAKSPGRSFLVLAESGVAGEFGDFLEPGLGELRVPEGVTVLRGEEAKVARFAAGDLVKVGVPVVAAARAAGLTVSGNGGADLVVVEREPVDDVGGAPGGVPEDGPVAAVEPEPEAVEEAPDVAESAAPEPAPVAEAEVAEAEGTDASEMPSDEVVEVIEPETEADAPAAEVAETPAEDMPEAETADAPVAEVTEAPEADTAEAPVAEVTEAPEADTAEAPVAEVTEAPEADTAEAPVAEVTEAPEAEVADAPEAADTGEAEAVVAAEPEPAEAPEPVMAETAEPAPADEVAPEVAETAPVAEPEDTRSEVEIAADDAAWRAARIENTEASYTSYLKAQPDGAYTNAANQRIKAIRSDPFYDLRRAEDFLGLTREARRDIQRDLDLLGYYTWAVDGIFGEGTRDAVRGWQKNAGMEETGYLDLDQIAKIEADAAAKEQAADAQRARERARQAAAAEAERKRAAQEAAAAAEAARAEPAPRRGPSDAAMWAEVERLGTEEQVRRYLRAYPNGARATQARNMLAVIERTRGG
ncbi:MAG: peptidoglycan-binding protein [Sagittula sp.]|uniref:peptidoglycan-binding protein n=2 Tax=Sagittula sp. TaxID=2038081 RepID=UPI00405A3BB3